MEDIESEWLRCFGLVLLETELHAEEKKSLIFYTMYTSIAI